MQSGTLTSPCQDKFATNGLLGQLDQILCAGIVHNASLCCIWEHMEELLDNGALVMLGSTKRPRQAKKGEGDYRGGCVCVLWF